MTNGVEYTTAIDLNSTGTTTVLDVGSDATAHGVHVPNGGSSAIIELQVTDGTTTVTLTTGQTAGDGIAYQDPLPLDGDNDLQVNVDTAEGSAQTTDAAVFVGE